MPMMFQEDDASAAFYCDEKMEFSRSVSHPTKSSSWKDVIILAEALIIFILICIIFLF
jgi:preprotein translocase subunit SecE